MLAKKKPFVECIDKGSSLLHQMLTDHTLSLFIMSSCEHHLLDLSASFCFFQVVDRHLGASAPLPSGGKGFLQPRFRCITSAEHKQSIY